MASTATCWEAPAAGFSSVTKVWENEGMLILPVGSVRVFSITVWMSYSAILSMSQSMASPL